MGRSGISPLINSHFSWVSVYASEKHTQNTHAMSAKAKDGGGGVGEESRNSFAC